MEGSLAAIFMEGNLPGIPLSWATSGESVEELQQQLISTSMELQNACDAAKMQSKVNEAKICHLQVLLDAARKERDVAHMKCSKLRDCLLHLSHSPQAPVPSAAESPCRLFRSSLSSTSSSAQFSQRPPGSPKIDAVSFQDPKHKSCVDEGLSIFEHDAHIKPLPHQSQDMQDIFALELNWDPSSITMEVSQQQFSMDILNEDVGLDENESLDLTDLQVDQPPNSTWEANLSSNSSWDAYASDGSSVGHTLSRQSSCVSSAASQFRGTVESPKVSATMRNQSLTLPGHQVFSMQPSHSPLQMPPHSMSLPEVSGFTNKAMQPHSAIMQLNSPDSAEPSICDSNVVHEGTLPEKGNLLQAVMQAGPLLQNLLLAGPLPQWRYPPPQLNTLDIPRVPMVPSSMPYDYASSTLLATNNNVVKMQSSLVSHMVSFGPANAAQFANHRGAFGASSVQPSLNAPKSDRNPCFGARKLRKLSPIGVK